MIREMANVELFELCETNPKVQCSECLLDWNQGVFYCTCGHLLVESESSQNFHQWWLGALLIPHHVIRKGRPRGARHGKTEAEKEHFVAHNARKRCLKKNFDGIHDRFQRDPVYRDSQLKIGWTEEKCIAMDKLAQEDHSYCPSSEEYERYRKTGISHWTNQAECTDETPIRLPNNSHNYDPSPRIWRRTTWTNPFSSIPKVAFVFFFQYLLVAVEWKLVELIIKLFFVARSFTVDGNLLQPTGGANRTPSHVTFSRVCPHSW